MPLTGPFTVKRNLHGNYIGFRNSRKDGWDDDISRRMAYEVSAVMVAHDRDRLGLELGVLCLNYMYEVRARAVSGKE